MPPPAMPLPAVPTAPAVVPPSPVVAPPPPTPVPLVEPLTFAPPVPPAPVPPVAPFECSPRELSPQETANASKPRAKQQLVGLLIPARLSRDNRFHARPLEQETFHGLLVRILVKTQQSQRPKCGTGWHSRVVSAWSRALEATDLGTDVCRSAATSRRGYGGRAMRPCASVTHPGRSLSGSAPTPRCELLRPRSGSEGSPLQNGNGTHERGVRESASYSPDFSQT